MLDDAGTVPVVINAILKRASLNLSNINGLTVGPSSGPDDIDARPVFFSRRECVE